MNIWMLDHYAVPLKYYPDVARPHKMAEKLVEMGHKVRIFSASSVHKTDINLINDRRLFIEDKVGDVNHTYIRALTYKGNGYKRILNILQYTYRLKRVLKKYDKPDVIIATSFHPLNCLKAVQYAKKNNIKVISYIADLWPLTLVEMSKLTDKNIFVKILYKLERWIYENSNAVVFTMEGGKDYIKDKGWDVESGGKVDLAYVYHINNGVDIKDFYYNREHYVINDADLNDTNKFKILYTGSISQTDTGVKTIISVARRIKKLNFKDIIFIIYGDGTERKKLVKYCEDNDLDNVKFKGKIDKCKIPYVLSKSSLNLMFLPDCRSLYKYGGSFNKSFEYLASEKPILMNISIGYDYIQTNGAGVCFDESDVESGVEAILKFYNMPVDEYGEFCCNAKRISQNYDFKVLTYKLIDVIESI